MTDVIEFTLCDVDWGRDRLNPHVQVSINGIDLVELLRAGDAESQYLGLDAKLLPVLGEDHHPFGMPDWQLLYTCPCGDPICDSIFVEFIVEAGCIHWNRFFRPGADCENLNVGPFTFNGQQYAEAMSTCVLASARRKAAE